MLRIVDDQMIELLDSIGLMLGYPEDPAHQSPLEEAIAEMVEDVVADIAAGADFEDNRAAYRARADVIMGVE